MPAIIEISGRPCNVRSFDMTNLNATIIVCESGPEVTSKPDNHGNRGITLVSDKVLTSSTNLGRFFENIFKKKIDFFRINQGS